MWADSSSAVLPVRATYAHWNRPAAEKRCSAKRRCDAKWAKLKASSVLTGGDGRKTVGDALLLSLSPASAELSTHFEISPWPAQELKHVGLCCAAEWQVPMESPLQSVAAWCNLTASSESNLKGHRRRCGPLPLLQHKNTLLTFYSDILPVGNGKFPISVIHCL